MTTQKTATVTPAALLVKKNKAHFPNESEVYRRARNELLVEEIELRRNLERVAELRRNLPPGGEVKTHYSFVGENGPVTLSELFGDKSTLVIYSYMFPKGEHPCPMCTSLMSAWDHHVQDIEQRTAFACIAKAAPIEKLKAAKAARGWTQLKIYADGEGTYSRDYVNEEGADIPGFNVFTKKDGVIRHFYSGEISGEMADPGQDSRGAPDLDSLWPLLDMTPEGRGDWYPKLAYPKKG